jgi:hypothetical protein
MRDEVVFAVPADRDRTLVRVPADDVRSLVQRLDGQNDESAREARRLLRRALVESRPTGLPCDLSGFEGWDLMWVIQRTMDGDATEPLDELRERLLLATSSGQPMEGP